MELLGSVSGPGSEKFEVVVQIGIGVVEGVQIDYMNTLAFVDHQGEAPVWALNSSLRSLLEGTLE